MLLPLRKGPHRRRTLSAMFHVVRAHLVAPSTIVSKLAGMLTLGQIECYRSFDVVGCVVVCGFAVAIFILALALSCGFPSSFLLAGHDPLEQVAPLIPLRGKLSRGTEKSHTPSHCASWIADHFDSAAPEILFETLHAASHARHLVIRP